MWVALLARLVSERNNVVTQKNISQDNTARMKNPFYIHRLLLAIVAVFIITGCSHAANGSKGSESKSTSSTSASSVSDQKTDKKDEPKAEAEKPTKDTDNSVPTEYKSALKQAETYSKYMHMSKQGIYKQLTSEYGGKFKPEAAQYAIDNVQADWNENALKKAQSYQKDMHMSPEAIRDQLTSEYGEKFTPEEAEYAVSHLS